jgi:hypothetical protein
MPNRTEARPAKAVLTYATGRLPLLRLFSTPLINHSLTRIGQFWSVNAQSGTEAQLRSARSDGSLPSNPRPRKQHRPEESSECSPRPVSQLHYQVIACE